MPQIKTIRPIGFNLNDDQDAIIYELCGLVDNFSGKVKQTIETEFRLHSGTVSIDPVGTLKLEKLKDDLKVKLEITKELLPTSLNQEEVELKISAIECRINAIDRILGMNVSNSKKGKKKGE